MGFRCWFGRHRARAAVAAGALLALAGLAAALSHALARPVEVRADTVLVSGPLRAAAPGGADAGTPLAVVRESLAAFLGGPTGLDVAVAGGLGRPDGGTVAFDLVLRKAATRATGELTLRDATGALVLAADARLDGGVTRVTVTGRGPLAPLAGWAAADPLAPLGDYPLDLRLDADLDAAGTATVRGRVALGADLGLDGDATLRKDRLHARLARVAADLALVARVAGLGWEPSGRAELAGVAVAWPLDGSAPPAVTGTLRIPRLAVPAAGAGVALAADGLEARLAVDLDARGAPVRVAAEGIRGGVEGAALRGTLRYDVAGRRLDAAIEGASVAAGGLVRRLAPGWLGADDGLELGGLRLTVSGLDPRGLGAGTVRLDADTARWTRPRDGTLATARTRLEAALRADTLEVALDASGVAVDLPALRGELPRLAGRAVVGRGRDAGALPVRATLAAHDAEGREMLSVRLAPGGVAARRTLSLRVPDLGRLDGLWPDLPRRVKGTLGLDVELLEPGPGAFDGRLELVVPEAELFGGRVSLRDLAAEVPVRRGGAGEPPWGTLEVGEVIAYGVLLRDLASPARVVFDRLSLNDLAYALYSGSGAGWVEAETEPAGPRVRGRLSGAGARIEELMSTYGIRGGTMTGLLRYEVDFQYRTGRLGLKGRFDVPEGGTVNIELLDRLLQYAEADPSGVLRETLQNLRAFEYKSAEAEVHTSGDDIRVSLALKGRERFGIFPPKVRAINVRNLPLSFLARQFPGARGARP